MYEGNSCALIILGLKNVPLEKLNLVLPTPLSDSSRGHNGEQDIRVCERKRQYKE
jgi:hypothetical protein